MSAPSQISARPASARSVDLDSIQALVKTDLDAVNEVIRTQLRSDVGLVNDLGEYIVNSGGKRLRPIVVLLAARACACKSSQYIDLAAVIEFIHTATLLHDDVVDGSDLRRGKETANAHWGNEAAVLVGDFVYSRAFEMMVAIGDMRVMDVMSHTTNKIAEGEVLQLINCGNPDTTEAEYLEVIQRKTAQLFQAGTRIGAIISGASDEVIEGMAQYGQHLGIAYQLVDDLLDYSDSSQDIGKNVGDDLAEGKPTLPLINAMQNGSPEQVQLLREAIKNGQRERIELVKKTIHNTGSMDYTANLARKHASLAEDALANIPNSSFRGALIDLVHFCVSRTY